MPYPWKPEELSTVQEARDFVRAVQRAFRPDRDHSDWGLAR